MSNASDFTGGSTVSLSGLALLATVDPSPSRRGYLVQNQDEDAAVVVLDDGQGTVPTYIVLAKASAEGAGDGGRLTFLDAPHTGRIRVYGTAGAALAAATFL